MPHRVSFGNEATALIDLDRVNQRPQTGAPDQRTSSILKYANHSDSKQSARLGTSSSREEFRAMAKAKRDAELREIEKEEQAARRKEQSEIEAKERIVERNRSQSKSRKSDVSSPPRRGAGGFEDDDDDY